MPRMTLSEDDDDVFVDSDRNVDDHDDEHYVGIYVDGVDDADCDGDGDVYVDNDDDNDDDDVDDDGDDDDDSGYVYDYANYDDGE